MPKPSTKLAKICIKPLRSKVLLKAEEQNLTYFFGTKMPYFQRPIWATKVVAYTQSSLKHPR